MAEVLPDRKRKPFVKYKYYSDWDRAPASQGQKRTCCPHFHLDSRKMAHLPPTPVAIRAPHGASLFEITWPQSIEHKLPHRLLRGYCPCAGCQGHSGTIRFHAPSGSLAVELRDIQKVGQYALGLIWGDSHATGIYSFEFLFHMGKLLEEHGAEGLESLEILPRPGQSR